MNHLYIKYRNSNGNIIDRPESNSDILIYDAGQYDNVYITVGEIRNELPYLNRMKYWDLSYYEHEFPEDRMSLIKESLLDIIAREFCTGEYRIIDEEYDWFAKYNELKRCLSSF